MSLTGISNISDTYIQSLLSSLQTSSSTSGTTGNSIDASSLTLPQDGSPQLSPFAQVMSSLQQLQQTDPAKYQQVTSEIATNLQKAAQTATANGNTSQAAELNQLASDFTNASQNNTLPSVKDLAQAIGAGHGHHHHHHAESSSSSSGSSTSTSATANTTSANGTTSADSLNTLISAFLTNSTGSSQNSSLDPMSIITNTLDSAGIQLAQ